MFSPAKIYLHNIYLHVLFGYLHNRLRPPEICMSLLFFRTTSYKMTVEILHHNVQPSRNKQLVLPCKACILSILFNAQGMRFSRRIIDIQKNISCPRDVGNDQQTNISYMIVFLTSNNTISCMSFCYFLLFSSLHIIHTLGRVKNQYYYIIIYYILYYYEIILSLIIT